MDDSIIVYSCLTGAYKGIKDNRVYVNPSDKFNSDRMNAKAPKVLSHLYLPIHEYSIWIDANLELLISPLELISLMDNKECLVFTHPFRKTINEEIIACKNLDSFENLNYHKNKKGILAACGVIIRKNTETVNKLNEYWWAEICRGSSRDQLSFPYTLGAISNYLKTEIQFPFNSKFIKWNPHK